MKSMESCQHCMHREVCYRRKGILDAAREVASERPDQEVPEETVWEEFLGSLCNQFYLNE